MSKLVALAILTTLMFGSCQESPITSRTAPPPDESMEVTVWFGGMMVFNTNPTTHAYEVGILKDLPKHRFCVQRGAHTPVCREVPLEKNSAEAKAVDSLPSGDKWTLTITNPLPSGGPIAVGHGGKRRPDVEAGAYDADWIIDLDGEEFHNGKLDLQEGHLNPIIQLPPNISLFTQEKSPDLLRKQGSGSMSPFGFVAETVGFRVQLRPNEELILKSGDEVITRVTYRAPHPVGKNSETLYISNARYPRSKDSDFKMYYMLFPGIGQSNQFDFDENKNIPCDTTHNKPCQAFNPAPAGDRSCCELVCSAIRLVKSDYALR